MTETQKRIKAYKDALPGLKERVAAVALLMVMSFAMMTSASFAWLTISRQPEVTGVSTTVAANGNLEIALVGEEGGQPEDSAVGDSSAAEGKSVVASNITWGNLVNLSDASYGLENLILRPAQLNTSSLLESPLYGAMYGDDGRITQLSSDFSYATWVPPTPATNDKPALPGYFGVSDSYGVRAITSVKVDSSGADAIYQDLVSKAKAQNLLAATNYSNLGNTKKYMDSLANMMGLFMTASLNEGDSSLGNPTCPMEDLQNLRDMYKDFLNCMNIEVDAMVHLINAQQFLMRGEGNYTPYTREMLLATTEAELRNSLKTEKEVDGVMKTLYPQITGLNQFLTDRNTIAADYATLVNLCNTGGTLKWSDSGLDAIVGNLVNVGTCTLDDKAIDNIGMTAATTYLDGKTHEAKITNGILKRFEQRTGGYIEVRELEISVTVKVVINVTESVAANITTDADRTYTDFNNDVKYTNKTLNTGFVDSVLSAKDTYGMAIDLWVRTNASTSYLTLEGNVLTKTENVRATGTDSEGNTVELSTLTVSQTVEGEESSYTIEIYEKNGKYYNAKTHQELLESQLGDNPMITPKMEELVTVLGYEGENRVWDDSKMLSTDATTQGSGSCYVFYATPENQDRSLKLLEAFKVAFVDGSGKLLGYAIMDTEHYYANNGRVIVPLVLDPSQSVNLGTDINGETQYGLTMLEQNVATRITAIIYLDGTKLTNQEVLAASEIQGQLNIQFGSSQSMIPMDNEELENAERRVTASIDNTSFDYDQVTGPMTTNVTVTVDGEQPTEVKGFFLRAVSDTQGAREETMIFTPDSNGNWISNYTFTSPGTYILRTVQLDGIDYDLPEPQQVVVSGFSISSLICTQAVNNQLNIMTAANSTTVNFQLRFATDDVAKMPDTVVGRFVKTEDGSLVNIKFTMDSKKNWNGTATFLTSGEYRLEQLVLDGQYAPLPEAMWHTANVNLGMRVEIYSTSPKEFVYKPSEMLDNMKALAVEVKIVDNGGKAMTGLSGLKLVYRRGTSETITMDANLTWNGKYYVGAMPTAGPGIWSFLRVEMSNDNDLTLATTSPTFNIKNPEQPSYYDQDTTGYQYAPNNDAKMNVQLIASNTADAVYAELVKRSNNGETRMWVQGVMGTDLLTTDNKTATNYNFTVPEEGHWEMTQVKLVGVYLTDGTLTTEEDPMIIELPEENVTKVVSRLHITFPEGKSQNFGKDASGNVTGTFMTSHTISGLTVSICDFENEPIPNLTDVKLTIQYVNQSSKDYGGYESASLNNGTDGATLVVPLIQVQNTAQYNQQADQTIRFAGDYTTTFSFKVGDKTYTYKGNNDDAQTGTLALPANAPKYTVWSMKPSLTVKSAKTYNWEMNNGNQFKAHTKSGSSSSALEAKGNVYDADTNSLTAYISAFYWSGQNLWVTTVGAGMYYTYKTPSITDVFESEEDVASKSCPQVVLELTNTGYEFNTASIYLAGDNNLSISDTISRNGKTSGTFTTASMQLGNVYGGFGYKNWTVNCTTRTVFGSNKVISQITMNYGGMDFKVDVAKPLTISNPY